MEPKSVLYTLDRDPKMPRNNLRLTLLLLGSVYVFQEVFTVFRNHSPHRFKLYLKTSTKEVLRLVSDGAPARRLQELLIEFEDNPNAKILYSTDTSKPFVKIDWRESYGRRRFNNKNIRPKCKHLKPKASAL